MRESKIKRTPGQGLVAEWSDRPDRPTGSAGHISRTPPNSMAAGRPDAKIKNRMATESPSPRGSARRLTSTDMGGADSGLPNKARGPYRVSDQVAKK